MKRQKTQQTGKLSFYPAIPAEAVRQAFIKSAAQGDTGADSRLEQFVYAADGIIKSGVRSFMFADLLAQCKRLGFDDAVEVKRLFGQWSEIMESMGKMTCVNGCYSDPIYILN